MTHAFRHLVLFVTESCNLACPYCFARNRSELRDMPLSLARDAIEWLCSSSSDRVHVTFWGGEPLLRLGLLRECEDLPFHRWWGGNTGRQAPRIGSQFAQSGSQWSAAYAHTPR